QHMFSLPVGLEDALRGHKFRQIRTMILPGIFYAVFRRSCPNPKFRVFLPNYMREGIPKQSNIEQILLCQPNEAFLKCMLFLPDPMLPLGLKLIIYQPS